MTVFYVLNPDNQEQAWRLSVSPGGPLSEFGNKFYSCHSIINGSDEPPQPALPPTPLFIPFRIHGDINWTSLLFELKGTVELDGFPWHWHITRHSSRSLELTLSTPELHIALYPYQGRLSIEQPTPEMVDDRDEIARRLGLLRDWAVEAYQELLDWGAQWRGPSVGPVDRAIRTAKGRKQRRIMPPLTLDRSDWYLKPTVFNSSHHCPVSDYLSYWNHTTTYRHLGYEFQLDWQELNRYERAWDGIVQLSL